MAKIIVRTVGQCFGAEASVVDGKEVLHTTRTFPNDNRQQAHAAAQAWAEKHGVRVETPEQR